MASRLTYITVRGFSALSRHLVSKARLRNPITVTARGGFKTSTRYRLPEISSTIFSDVGKQGGKESEHQNPEVKCLISNSKLCLEFKWNDDASSDSYYSMWLRHNCHCAQCKQAHSGQNLVEIHKIPGNLLLDAVAIDHESQNLHIKWSNHNHEVVLPLKWLKANSYANESRLFNSQQREVVTYAEEGLPPAVEFSDISSSAEVYWKWLLQINEYGISIVKNVPTEKGKVANVAELIAPVMETFYGRVFDVVASDSPVNIAYSDVGLPLHCDLIYLESPPGLQLLHCIELSDDLVGGRGLFLDMFYVAEEFRKASPESFEALVRIPATFQKVHYEREKPVHLTYQQPHIVLNHIGQIVAVNWAPAFEGPLHVSSQDVPQYYKAYREFSEFIHKSKLIKSYTWAEGDCIVFNNHRVVHGRTGYDSTKHKRHLQGCYVNMDDYRSKFCVTSQLYGDGRPSRRVGNRDFF